MPVEGIESVFIPCSCCGSLIFKNALFCEGFSFVRCKKCGLVQRNPQPVKEEIISRYSAKFGNDYLAYELENESAFLTLQRLALEDAHFFKLEKELFYSRENAPSFLDIGCAAGSLLSFLKERKWRVTGVEISPCAGYAQKIRNLDVKGIPLEENAFPCEYFDVIHASHLIEHLNDPRSFLNEAHRILKKDGKIFITTPNIDGFQARLFKSRWRSAIFDHLYLFSIRTLKEMLKRCGFKTEKTAVWGGLASGLAPVRIKKIADFLAKHYGCGDVMIIRAGKI